MRFDPQATLSHIETRLGQVPRRTPNALIREFRRARPGWAAGKDQIGLLYERLEKVIQRGAPRWAAVVHANETVWQPGLHMSGAQIVYEATGEVELQAVIAVAERCYETKHGERANDEEKKLGEMLANEMERALDWPIPASLSDGAEMYTSIAMLPRENTPYRFMAMKHFPVLADPETRFAWLVPHAYWDEAFLRAWKREAIKTLITIKLAKGAEAGAE